MIFGINFNGTPIPQTPRSAFRKFPPTVGVRCHRCDGTGREATDEDYPGQHVAGPADAERCTECRGRKRLSYQLKGIGQSPAERDAMLIQANNGTRRLHVEERQTVGGVWFGIYCW